MKSQYTTVNTQQLTRRDENAKIFARSRKSAKALATAEATLKCSNLEFAA